MLSVPVTLCFPFHTSLCHFVVAPSPVFERFQSLSRATLYALSVSAVAGNVAADRIAALSSVSVENPDSLSSLCFTLFPFVCVCCTPV